ARSTDGCVSRTVQTSGCTGDIVAPRRPCSASWSRRRCPRASGLEPGASRDRKSTRLNSSHLVISYAVFCLKKKKNNNNKKTNNKFNYHHKQSKRIIILHM